MNIKELNEAIAQILNESKLLAYHGSQNKNFKLKNCPIYLTSDKEEAVEYAKGSNFDYDLSKKDVPTVYTLEVTMNNPKIITTEDEYYEYMDISNYTYWEDGSNGELGGIGDELVADGFDGVIYKPDGESFEYYLPFNAMKQCKITEKEII